MRLALIMSLALCVGGSTHLAAQEPTTLPHAFPREGAVALLENAWVAVWDVTWAANVSTPMHSHRYDYFGVELAAARARVTLPDGTSRDLSPKTGTTWFLPKGTTHIETGIGDNPRRHAIIIDLKDARSMPSANTTSLPLGPELDGSASTVANARVTMWSVTWRPERPSVTRFYERNVIIVFVDGGDVEETDADGTRRVRRYDSGQVQFLSAGLVRAYRALSTPLRVMIVRLET